MTDHSTAGDTRFGQHTQVTLHFAFRLEYG